MIIERLIPKLQRFKDRAMKLGTAPGPAVVFPAAHPEVGDLEVYEEHDELIVAIGKFTHTHFPSTDSGIPASERAERIAQEVAAFLDDVFAERVEFFGPHFGAGGYRRRRKKPPGFIFKLLFGRRTYVWSGPIWEQPRR